jgi:hypothetical protein
VDIVLADGKIVTASRHKNSQLFWAIRGAGASFGAVISFTFQAHSLKHDVWGGTLVIDIADLDKVVAFANEFLKVSPIYTLSFFFFLLLRGKLALVLTRFTRAMQESHPKSAFIWGFKALSPTSFGIVAAVFYNGVELTARVIFAKLLDLRILANSTYSRPYSSMNTLFNDDLRAGHRRSMKGSAFIAPLDLNFARECFQDFRDLIRETPDAFMSLMVFEFFPFGKIISVSQHDTAFANRGAYGNMLWIMGWMKEENDEGIRAWTRAMSEKAHEQFQIRKKTLKKDGVTEFGKWRDNLQESYFLRL